MKDIREVFSSYAKEYQRTLGQEPIDSPEYFRAAIIVAASKLTTSQLADEFKITESTIYRYINGRSHPMKNCRKGVLERVVNMLEDVN